VRRARRERLPDPGGENRREVPHRAVRPRAVVIDEDDVLFARALRDKGTPMPDIVKKLTIKTGKNAGQHPSVASLYRALADNDA
jgi:hypothetical protein